MKTITAFIASLLCLAAFNVAGAVLEILASTTNNSSHPVILRLEGAHHDPPGLLPGSLQDPVDRTSIAGICEAYATALKQKNTNLFNSIFLPNERTTDFAPDASAQFGKILLCEQWNYGPYIIAALEMEVNNHIAHTCLCIKKTAEGLFATDTLAFDPGYAFLKTIWQNSENNFSRTINAMVQSKPGYFTNRIFFAQNQIDTPPIVILTYGTNYADKGPIQYEKVTEKNFSQGSPEKATLASFGAIAAKNKDWYLSLICPSELDLNKETGTIRQVIPREILRSEDLLSIHKPYYFDKVAEFSGYAIVTIKTTKDPQFLVFKNEQGNWRITDELNLGQPLLALLIGSDTPGYQPLSPKVFPF